MLIALHRYQKDPALNVIKWGKDWEIYCKPILYRFAAFRIEDDRGNEEMFEIIVPHRKMFERDERQSLFARHVRFRKEGTELYVREYKSSEQVPLQRPSTGYSHYILNMDILAFRNAVGNVITFYRKMRNSLVWQTPAWKDVLTEEKEALVETSAKRFFHSMAMVFDAAQPTQGDYGYIDVKKFDASLIPFIERLTSFSSSDTGPLSELDIFTISPENTLPFYISKNDFLPLTAPHTEVRILPRPPEREAFSRYFLNMSIPLHLRERLRIKHVHHEASWKTDNTSKSVYSSRFMGVGMLDENNPGVFVLEAFHRDEVRETTAGVGARFFVAPLLALFYPHLLVEGNDWLEGVLDKDSIRMP